MPVALFTEDVPAIISQAYPIFEIIDTTILLPEYLMMWFTRSEFDREACFHAVGGVRGSLEWEDFCGMKLPIPSPEKQLEIVKEYNTIQNRISLNNQLISKLEETAQAIYKQWFVDFEFPDENGKPYKSNGGEMFFSEDLEKEIPVGFAVSNLGSLLEEKGYIRGPFGSALKVSDMRVSGVPVYEQQHVLDEHRNFRYFIDKDKFKALKRFTVKANDILISCSGVNLGKLTYVKTIDPIGIINQALLILRVDSSIISSICIKYFLSSKEGKRLLIGESGGSAIPNIAKREVLQSIPFLLPNHLIGELLGSNLLVISKKTELIDKEIDLLVETKNIVLSKMSKIESGMVTAVN
jgi:type I restriction enzyme S subunit